MIKEKWAGELNSEVQFWKEWLSGRQSLVGCSDFDQLVNVDLLKSLIEKFDEPVRILDIGSGVSSFLSYVDLGKEIEVIAVDALADEYTKLCAGIERSNIPIQCEAEKIGELFAEWSFDLIHIRNSLDHCYGPLEVLQQSMALLRPGGYLYLGHLPNVRTYSGSTGLHLWDFNAIEGRLSINNNVIDIGGEVKLLTSSGPLIEFTVQKADTYPDTKPELDLRSRLHPRKLTVLNVGVGPIAPSHLARQLPYLPFKRLDNLDVYAPYLESARSLYKWSAKEVRFILADAAEFSGYADYDLVMFFDVLEHIEKEAGLKILAQCPHALIFSPIDPLIESPEVNPEGDPNKKHISYWDPNEFPPEWKVEVLTDCHDVGWRKFSAMWVSR